MSDEKTLLESIEALSSTPGKWTIFKFKMQTAFDLKDWSDHLIQTFDPNDEPAEGDKTLVRDAKAEQCKKWLAQQMKSKAMLVGKLDDMTTQMIMHLDHTHKIW